MRYKLPSKQEYYLSIINSMTSRKSHLISQSENMEGCSLVMKWVWVKRYNL